MDENMILGSILVDKNGNRVEVADEKARAAIEELKKSGTQVKAWLRGTTQTVTPAQVMAALNNDQNVAVEVETAEFGKIVFTGFTAVMNGAMIIASASATMYIEEQGDNATGFFALAGAVDTGVWTHYFTQLATFNDFLMVGQDLDRHDQEIVGLRTDVTGLRTDVNSLYEEIAEDDLPTVYYGGNLPQIKTEQIMSLRIVSKTMDVKGYCETKAQGNSSMNFPKKNQTTKLYADVTCEKKLKLAFRNWGKQQKFCLKANWNDLSHARNVVSARIWGDMVRTRPDFDSIPELMRTSPNFGAIDGFPVRVFAAGTYQGRYAFNIPKDKWMANMDDENPNHCILCGEDYGSGCFRAPALIDGNDWTDEIHDDVPANILTRWNECITFVQNSTDDEFKANLHNYFNVASLIDYHIFGLVSCNMDGFGKNQLFMTYDGRVWYASVYDMDATWGNHYMGTKLVSADYPRTAYEDYVSSASSGNGNLLYVRLEALFADEIKERWNDVKTTALSLDSILNNFEKWASICPPWIVAEDYAETTAEGAFVDMPGQDYNNIQQIRAFAKARHAWTETYINGEPTVNLWNIGERTYKLLPFSATKDKAPNYEVGLDEFALSGSRTGYMTGNRQVEHTIEGNNITFKPIESGVGLFMPVDLTPGKTYRLRFTTSDATGTMAVTWYDDTIKYIANTGALTPNDGLSYEGTFVAANYPHFALTAVAAGTTIPETITFSDVSLVELL